MSQVQSVDVKTLRKVLLKFSDLDFQWNTDNDKRKLGKILTIIDGSISDETQRKAVKDMVHDAWYRAGDLTIHKPGVYQVTEALGFQLYETFNGDSLAVPAERYNPFKEVVKE